jgi:glucose/arabinose dehydrogenase
MKPMKSTSYEKTRLMQLVLAFLVFLFSCSKDAEQTSPPDITPPPTGIPDITITTLLNNQGVIWGFDVLPNGNLLFTQKAGTMQLLDVNTRTTTNITGLPTNIISTGQGGLLDVAVSPDYPSSGNVFVTTTLAI